MTAQDLKEFVENIIDDSIDDDFFMDLLNMEKDMLLGDREWEVMRSTDTSEASSPGDTYLTMKDLPSNFGTPTSHLYIGTNQIHKPIPFNERYSYRNSNGLFYIDYANNQFAIIGAPGTVQTINLPYIVKADEVTSLTDDLDSASIFPLIRNGQKLLGIKIAAYFTGGIDYDDIYARMSPQHQMMARRIEKQLEEWNNKLALNAMDYSASEFNHNDLNIGSL